MKTLLLAALLALPLGDAAAAATVTFPSEVPVASVTVPDNWKAAETDTGLQVTAPDDVINLYLDISKAENREAVVEEAFKFLADSGVTLDTTKDDASSGVINGMPVSVHNFDGKDQNGPVTIGLYIIQTNPSTDLVATYWGTKGEQDKFGADMSSIMESLKPAGN